MARKLKTISQKTAKLLKSGETERVDYKIKLSAMHAEDVVAFANSELGGTILIGVNEGSNTDGTQHGIVLGHAVGDKQELAIVDKASQCVPPIAVKVCFENTSAKAIIRVDIPSGSHKPYCTVKGVYKIRDGNRNVGILPNRLLEIFMNNETDRFSSRFKESTQELVTYLSSMSSSVEGLESVIESKIDDISSSMMMAEWEAEDASSSAKAVLGLVSEIKNETLDNRKRLKCVVDKLKVPDPLKAKHKKELRDSFVEYINQQDHEFISKLVANKDKKGITTQNLPDSLTVEDEDEVYKDVINELVEILNRSKDEEE